jgi:cellulose synthase/poly-beta-1,6-N-acetylglucosamine synthase-like glycosyltransferase
LETLSLPEEAILDSQPTARKYVDDWLSAKQKLSRCFVVVCARDASNVPQKIAELEDLGISFLIVCGEEYDHPRVVYRALNGKWDAINFACNFIPQSAKTVIFNDCDTKIYNYELALACLRNKADVVYCRVHVDKGPQVMFYRILNPIRQRFNVCASGELMLIKREVLEEITPIPPCIAEDSYLLFKALELGFKAYFCSEAYVTTKRTTTLKEEEAYKRRTTLGIYQALNFSKPPFIIRAFYYALPVISPLLMLAGKNGEAWSKGIQKAVKENHAKKQVTKF